MDAIAVCRFAWHAAGGMVVGVPWITWAGIVGTSMVATPIMGAVTAPAWCIGAGVYVIHRAWERSRAPRVEQSRPTWVGDLRKV